VVGSAVSLRGINALSRMAVRAISPPITPSSQSFSILKN
jgi:hypothetical protein